MICDKIWDYSVYFRFILKVGTLREVLLFSLPRNLKLIIVFTITMITNKVLYLIINIRLITAKKSFIYFKIMFVGGYSWKKINLYRFSRNGYILTYRHQLHVIQFLYTNLKIIFFFLKAYHRTSLSSINFLSITTEIWVCLHRCTRSFNLLFQIPDYRFLITFYRPN